MSFFDNCGAKLLIIFEICKFFKDKFANIVIFLYLCSEIKHKHMKKWLVFMLVAVTLWSCNSGNERTLTSATGSIYECLIVCEADVQVPVTEIMGGDMYGLPQMEAYFTVAHTVPAQFDAMYMASRNILIVDINSHKYTQVKATHYRDQWSKPQAVVRIQAPDNEAFLAYWSENGESVRDWFVREELARQAHFYRAGTNKNARAKLQKQGYDICVPEDYMLIKDTVLAINDQTANIIWCCNNHGPMRRDVLVYSYPYTAQEQFSGESIIAVRNLIMGQLVSAQVEGSHMGTEYKHFPPVTRSVAALRDTVGGFYGMETRGLWKMLDGEAMGGPFVSLTRLDQVNGRVVTAEAFLYAPGQKKRNAMRQAEAILYTLEMPNERQR